MRGYPKHLNTKQDVLNAMHVNEARTKAWLQSAIDFREGWVTTKAIESVSEGVEDSTHRVRTIVEEDMTTIYQEQWGPIPGNALDRVGMTVAEAKKLLK